MRSLILFALLALLAIFLALPVQAYPCQKPCKTDPCESYVRMHNPDGRPSLTLLGGLGTRDADYNGGDADVTVLKAHLVYPVSDNLSLLGGFDHENLDYDLSVLGETDTDVYSVGVRFFLP